MALKKTLLAYTLAFAAATSAVVAHAQAPAAAQPRTEIQMWMGLTGVNGELLSRFGEDFNRSQNEYRVVVSFRGQYPEQRAAAMAAFRAGNPPHIMQMFDAGSGDMIQSRGAIIPVSQVFQRAGIAFNPADFIAPARGYYGLPNGELLSMPFNVSTAVLFYNRDAFTRAGLDPNRPPRTWPEMIAAAKQIRERNAAECGFTTTWLAWIMLEQFNARHNQQIGTLDNGRGGAASELTVNNALNQRMVQTLIDLQPTRAFSYGGRSNDAAAKFISGQCAMLLQSSGGLAAIQRDGRFALGTAQLPHWPDVQGAPFATTIGGASLWVFNAPNRTQQEMRGIAMFLDFLRSDRVMTEWARTTGFLPATYSSFRAMQQAGFFTQNPGRDVPILSLIEARQGQFTQGYRFGRWTEIRNIYYEEVERALQGRQTAAQALRNFERRGNAQLRAFERSVN